MRTSLFWIITQWIVVFPYRRFEITYRSHIQESKIRLWLNQIAYGAMASWSVSGLAYRLSSFVNLPRLPIRMLFRSRLQRISFILSLFTTHSIFFHLRTWMGYMLTRIHEYLDILHFCCKRYEKKTSRALSVFILPRRLLLNWWSSYRVFTLVRICLQVFLSAHGSHTPVSTVPRWSPWAAGSQRVPFIC
jgi:hypothetical protein